MGGSVVPKKRGGGGKMVYWGVGIAQPRVEKKKKKTMQGGTARRHDNGKLRNRKAACDGNRTHRQAPLPPALSSPRAGRHTRRRPPSVVGQGLRRRAASQLRRPGRPPTGQGCPCWTPKPIASCTHVTRGHHCRMIPKRRPGRPCCRRSRLLGRFSRYANPSACSGSHLAATNTNALEPSQANKLQPQASSTAACSSPARASAAHPATRFAKFSPFEAPGYFVKPPRAMRNHRSLRSFRVS